MAPLVMALAAFFLFFNYDFLQGFICFSFPFHIFLQNAKCHEDCGKAAWNPDKDVRSQEGSDQRPQDDAVDDDYQLPREDAHEDRLDFRIRIALIFSALDEVSPGGRPAETEKTAWDGKELSRADPSCAEDHHQLDDGLRTGFGEGLVHAGDPCFVLDLLNSSPIFIVKIRSTESHVSKNHCVPQVLDWENKG